MDKREQSSGQELLQEQANYSGGSTGPSRFVTRPESRGGLIASLLHVEPVWILAMAVLVFLSYHFRWPAFLPWLWLSMAVAPFMVRRWHQGHLNLSTPFDIPIALLLGGALLGVVISPDLYISTGAFQCLLAMTLFYYSWVNYPRLEALMKWLITVAILGVVAHGIVSVIKITETPAPGALECTYHGLALALAIIAAIVFGVAIFGKGRSLRRGMALLGAMLMALVIVLIKEAIPRLVAGHSVDGRLPRWEKTAELLMESPFAGLGLGAWPQTFHGTSSIVHPTNVHNSYLELYSNMGILGVLALAASVFIAFKLGRSIWKSSGRENWRAIGIGTLMASVLVALVANVESSPLAVPVVGDGGYLYLMSPAPWILAGLVVSTHRLISK